MRFDRDGVLGLLLVWVWQYRRLPVCLLVSALLLESMLMLELEWKSNGVSSLV